MKSGGRARPAAMGGPGMDSSISDTTRLVARGKYSRIGIARACCSTALAIRRGVERMGLALGAGGRSTSWSGDRRRLPKDPRIAPMSRLLQRYVIAVHGAVVARRATRIALAVSTDDLCSLWRRLGLRSLSALSMASRSMAWTTKGRERCSPCWSPWPVRRSPRSRLVHRPLFPRHAPGEEKVRQSASPLVRWTFIGVASGSRMAACARKATGSASPLASSWHIIRLACPVARMGAPQDRCGGAPPIMCRHGFG